MISEKSLTKKRVLIFTVLAIALGWMVFLIVPLSGMVYGVGLTATLVIAAGMFTPTLANILTRLITREGFRDMSLRPNFKGHGKAYLALYFWPTALIFLSGAVYYLIFPGVFDPSMPMLSQVAQSATNPVAPGTAALLTALMVVTVGPVVNIIPTLGEELGWRGYLMPKLRELFSDRAALVITGIIWGFWHLPVIVMGHNYGTAYAGYPYLGILQMVVFCVSLGVIEGYVSIKLNSAIPAAMIHSTVNAGAALAVFFAKTGYNPLLGPAITGLVGGLPLIILAAYLFIRIGQKAEIAKAA